MREAIGGAALINLIIPIIVLLIVFIGFIMNYASTYRAANYVVTQIESCQGLINGDGCSSFKDPSTMSKTLASEYHYHGELGLTCLPVGNGSVYRVKLDVMFELPIFGKFNPLSVKAETKTLQTQCRNG